MQVNLGYNVEDVKNDPIDAGEYLAKISKCEVKTSKTGKEMLVVEWEITEEGEFFGHKAFDNVVLEVQFKVKQYADLIHLESGATLDTELFIGTEGILVIAQEEYHGDVQAKIKKVRPLGE